MSAVSQRSSPNSTFTPLPEVAPSPPELQPEGNAWAQESMQVQAPKDASSAMAGSGAVADPSAESAPSDTWWAADDEADAPDPFWTHDPAAPKTGGNVW